MIREDKFDSGAAPQTLTDLGSHVDQAISAQPLEPTEADPYIDTVVNGRYLIKSLLGYGGWSMVYLADDQLLKRKVAMKFLHLPFASDEEKRKRFEHEARAASSLNHPNIASTFDYGVMPFGQPYIVMEYLEGESLAERIDRKGPIPEAEAVALISQVAHALDHAHEKGIVHRDIKPSNILVTTSGGTDGTLTAKVLDFGLAKWLDETNEITQLTATGKSVGTPSYMSPEQCRGLQLDGRSDVYSLGCTLYEALCGVKPFTGNVLECMHAHLAVEPPPLKKQAPQVNVSVALEGVLRKSMAKDAEDRIPSARAFMNSLQASKTGGGPAILPAWWRLRDSASNLHPMVHGAIGALLCLVLAYCYAPQWLPLVAPLLGVKTLNVGVDRLDPGMLESVVSDMEKKGDLKQAQTLLENSLATTVKANGKSSVAAANSYLLLGKFFLRYGNKAAAKTQLSSAVECFSASGQSPEGLNTAQTLLNTVLTEQGSND